VTLCRISLNVSGVIWHVIKSCCGCHDNRFFSGLVEDDEVAEAGGRRGFSWRHRFASTSSCWWRDWTSDRRWILQLNNQVHSVNLLRSVSLQQVRVVIWRGYNTTIGHDTSPTKIVRTILRAPSLQYRPRWPTCDHGRATVTFITLPSQFKPISGSKTVQSDAQMVRVKAEIEGASGSKRGEAMMQPRLLRVSWILRSPDNLSWRWKLLEFYLDLAELTGRVDGPSTRLVETGLNGKPEFWCSFCAACLRQVHGAVRRSWQRRDRGECWWRWAAAPVTPRSVVERHGRSWSMTGWTPTRWRSSCKSERQYWRFSFPTCARILAHKILLPIPKEN